MKTMNRKTVTTLIIETASSLRRDGVYPRPKHEKVRAGLRPGINPSPTFFFSLVAAALLGCAPEFDDPTMAVVKKPEILSIVLEPPEAAPGETVRASFLMADDRGVIAHNANVWLPVSAGGEMSDAEMGAALEEMGLDLTSLGETQLEFTVPPASSFTFDEEGLSGQMLSLFAATGDTPDPETPVEQLLGTLDNLVESGEFKTALRTLVVSERSTRNQNPVIQSVSTGDEEAQENPVTIVLSSDEDIQSARQLAVDNPLIVDAKQKLAFAVDAEDDTDDGAALRFQWISTGGDFAGLRERVQEFEAPEYKELEPGDVDQTDLENVDPRTDPNLHPAWVIVRDDSTPGALGQSWAELYVRVQPAE